MSRRQARTLSTLLAGAAVVALAPAHALAENATLAQGDDRYFKQAQAALQRILTEHPNTNRAKNVILIVGDGMGFSTVTAARIFEGQQRGVDGRSTFWPGAFRTWPPRRPTRPTRRSPIGAKRRRDDDRRQDHQRRDGPRPYRQARQLRGPEDQGGDHALGDGREHRHVDRRDHHGDDHPRDAGRDLRAYRRSRLGIRAAMPPEALQAGCADIARQLVEMPYGDGFEVAMGGGRANFLPATAADPEYADKKGKRKDGADLTKAWLDRYPDGGAYVWNLEQFDQIDPAGVDHVLGSSRCRTCSMITTGPGQGRRALARADGR